MAKGVKGRLAELGVGAALYLNAIFSESNWDITEEFEFILYLAAYLALAAGVFRSLCSNLRKKRFFDENLLMLLATVGAMLVGEHREAVGAILFFQAGCLVELVSLGRTKKSIVRFMDIRPEYANLKTGQGEESVSPGRLEVGQVIVVRPGEKIPVDGVVVQGATMVDTKALTGEAEPRDVMIGDRVYSGSVNLGSVMEAKVTRVYAESTASRILRLVEEANDRKAESENFAARFTKYYTPAVTLLGILVMILPPMIQAGYDQEAWMYRGMIFLVAACPCGFLVSVPLAFLGGIGAASRQGVLIKGSNYLEALSKTETFVFDKTGTLTQGVFSVSAVCPEGITSEELLEITVCCEAYSTHPIGVSLRKAYGRKIDTSRVSNIQEHPGAGVEAEVDGRKVLIGSSKMMGRRGLYYHQVTEAGTAIHVTVDGTYAGYILISDAIRGGAEDTVRWMRKHQIEAVMLTGDNERAAGSVARQLGIEYVYPNLLPEDKVAQMEEFMESQLESEKLAFVGDGINDAPVLARADLGIAMGGLGSAAAVEAADIILMNDELTKLVNAIRISRGTVSAVRQNMVFAVGVKVILLFLAALGYVSMQNAIIADMVVMLINILNSFWVLKYPE